MNPTLAGYLGFVVAALILIWAVIEIGRRLTRRTKIDVQTPGTWVKLDSARNNASEELPPPENDEDDDAGDRDDIPERSLQARAQQNGHYSESKKPL
jgi:hypothetical protein